ncbi:MAG: SGNH/GDSL hydrolase family protein [Puia sp.]
MKFKNIFAVLLFCSLGIEIAIGQEQVNYKWWDPSKNSFPAIEGQAWPNDLAHPYDRFPAKAEHQLREVVWNKSQESAGLLLRFMSNTSQIQVRYKVKGKLAFEHMPATGVSGVDLYALDKAGKWRWAGVTYEFGDTITYHYQALGINQEREYYLYLPLYNKVSWLEIGVPDRAEFKPLPARNKDLVVIYGTSIAQGGCASRPGMAWTAILGRRLKRPVVNLGFSSNGLLEKPVIDLMCGLHARIFILDCLPNMMSLPEDTVRARLIDAIHTLQSKKPVVPVLIVEHADANMNLMDSTLDKNFKRMNVLAKSVFAELRSKGVRRIYFLSAEKIGLDQESSVDGSHPNDFGMERYANAYAHCIRDIFKQ